MHVPNFSLYGTQAQPAWAELVHHESIPERSRVHDWEIQPHQHDALLQVLAPVSGGGEALIDGRRWRLAPPCLIVVPARSVHGFRFDPGTDGAVITAAQRPLESLAAVAAPELLACMRRPAVLALAPDSRHADAVPPLVEAIAREAGVHAPGQVAAGLSLLLALFVQIARIGAPTAAAAAAPARSRKAEQIERFRALLDEHCRRRLPVAAYARALGLSAGQLTRLCREVLGCSSLALVNARALHEAERELVYAQLSVKQVAAELGFADEAYFGRFFRKHTGLTPTAFREAARQRLATP